MLFGGRVRTRANDTEYRFRPDSDFHYLTGLSEPEAVMLLLPGERAGDERLIMFVRKRDREAEIWSGRRPGPEGVKRDFGADEAHPLAAIPEQLPKLLDGCGHVWLPLGRDPGLDRRALAAIGLLKRRNRDGQRAPRGLLDAAQLIGEDRITKDAGALSSLRRAVELSAQAHTDAMKHTRPGMFEYEVEARLEYCFRRAGSSGPGYGSIVGAGDNATILHYVDNRDELADGSIILIDAGAEWDYFSGDITRSWPVNGKFTPPQRDLYEVVLAANEAGIEKSVVGSSIDAIHETCLRVLAEGMRSLNLLRQSVDEILAKQLYKRYYMHRTSHWLGVDVHDAGDYTIDGTSRPLEPGFVLTVEPALYVAADDPDAPQELLGTGVRIEDDVWVTGDGPEVLSKACPKAVAELEAIIGTEA